MVQYIPNRRVLCHSCFPSVSLNSNKIISKTSVKLLIEDLDLGSKSMLNLVKKSIGFQKTKDFNILEPNKKVNTTMP